MQLVDCFLMNYDFKNQEVLRPVIQTTGVTVRRKNSQKFALPYFRRRDTDFNCSV
jgi:hypothetical protein